MARPRRRPGPSTPIQPHRARVAALVLALSGAALSARACPEVPLVRATDPLGPLATPLLVEYSERFLGDHDLAVFSQHIAARYPEAVLARLVKSGSTPARRAAVLALGVCGGFGSNAAVARALRDPDPLVRSLADNALWAIWFRADTPVNNALLEQVRTLIGRQRLEEAIVLATRLIGRAPEFAEAYNQRAIARFLLGELEASAADCRRVLARNPYHFGALSGLAQCQLRLNQRREALITFRRALRLQPYSEGIRQAVAALEADGD
jgi:tetratricopeptide (TPR) repeat protein